MSDAPPAAVQDAASDSKNKSVEPNRRIRNWRIRFWALCAMLVLGLVAMGLTQASEKRAWEYWIFVVVVYAGLAIWQTAVRARSDLGLMSKSIVRELLHWGTLVLFLGSLFLLEKQEIINRESASYFALMLLAMTCCMSGVHTDWSRSIVGVVLTAMLITMAYIDQWSVVLWLCMITVAALGAAFFYFQSRRERA